MTNKDVKKKNRHQVLRERCREHVLKVTHQPLDILQATSSGENHPSAEEAFERVKAKLPTLSFDTVYRNFALFENSGVTLRVHHLNSKTRFDSNVTPHHYLVCTKCKKIQNFYWPDVEQIKIPEETRGWGTVHTKYVELRGLCRVCLEVEGKKK